MDTVLSGVRHHTFTVSRELDAPVETVFRAFSDESLRRRWFKMPGSDAEYEFDFRTGGTERASSNFTMLDGAQERVENRSRWIEIVSENLPSPVGRVLSATVATRVTPDGLGDRSPTERA